MTLGTQLGRGLLVRTICSLSCPSGARSPCPLLACPALIAIILSLAFSENVSQCCSALNFTAGPAVTMTHWAQQVTHYVTVVTYILVYSVGLMIFKDLHYSKIFDLNFLITLVPCPVKMFYYSWDC